MRFGSLAYFDFVHRVLSRYEIGGEKPRKTHSGLMAEDMREVLDREVAEEFRIHGHPDLYCGSLAPIPGDDGPNGSPAAAKAA